MPHRETYFFVCTNRRKEDDARGSCAGRGAEELLPALKASLAKRGAAKALRACGSTCLDLCEVGAVILPEPAHIVYGAVSVGDVEEIVDAALAGKVVERLRVAPPSAE